MADRELLNLSQAAKALGVTRRAVRKYFERAPELNHGSDGRPKVDLEELVAWRDANVNQAKRNGDAAHLAGGDDDAEVEIPDVLTDGMSFNEARRIREVIKARNEHLAHQKATREVVPIADAVEIVNDAARYLREAFPTRWRRLAPKLKDAKSAAEIARLLQAESDAVLRRLAEQYGS